MAEPLLRAEHLGISFRGLRALDDVNFSIPQGAVMGLIGPNGAGKTTLFNLLTGVYTPTDGTVTLDGEVISGKGMRYTVRHGISRTFQNIRLFKDMTVLDNVKAAMHDGMHYNLLESVLKTRRFWLEEENADSRALELLAVFDLDKKADMRAGNLPYGQQRKLEIARALATNPKLLCLDEPAAGMNNTETRELMETIAFIRQKFGISILLIEHDMPLVMGVCERIVVLDYGKVIADGTPDEVVKKHGFQVVSDDGALEKAVDEALAANPDIVEKLKSGNMKPMGAIIGAVMRATRGQADAKAVTKIVMGKIK